MKYMLLCIPLFETSLEMLIPMVLKKFITNKEFLKNFWNAVQEIAVMDE